MTHAAFLLAAALTTPVLIPTFYNGPGQFDSQWRTDVFVVNPTEQSIDGRGATFFVPCPIPEACPSGTLGPRQEGILGGPESDRGLLLHLPADAAHRVEFDAHFGEDRRSYALPIVREDDFHDDRFGLPLVPLLGDFRTTLRIYSPDPLVDQQVILRLMPASNPFGEPLATRVVTLDVTVPESLPLRPAFAQLVLQREFPEATRTNGAVRIEFEPVPRLDGRIPRVWAFATVTFNDRNDVVVIMPQ
jgi:hypothetical protein